MRVLNHNPVTEAKAAAPKPPFQPVYIVLDTETEAAALKRLTSASAIKAVKNKPNMSITANDVISTGNAIYRALRDRGVNYLSNNPSRASAGSRDYYDCCDDDDDDASYF